MRGRLIVKRTGRMERAEVEGGGGGWGEVVNREAGRWRIAQCIAGGLCHRLSVEAARTSR